MQHSLMAICLFLRLAYQNEKVKKLNRKTILWLCHSLCCIQTHYKHKKYWKNKMKQRMNSRHLEKYFNPVQLLFESLSLKKKQILRTTQRIWDALGLNTMDVWPILWANKILILFFIFRMWKKEDRIVVIHFTGHIYPLSRLFICFFSFLSFSMPFFLSLSCLFWIGEEKIQQRQPFSMSTLPE